MAKKKTRHPKAGSRRKKYWLKGRYYWATKKEHLNRPKSKRGVSGKRAAKQRTAAKKAQAARRAKARKGERAGKQTRRHISKQDLDTAGLLMFTKKRRRPTLGEMLSGGAGSYDRNMFR